jgi:hypothetical protein
LQHADHDTPTSFPERVSTRGYHEKPSRKYRGGIITDKIRKGREKELLSRKCGPKIGEKSFFEYQAAK